MRKHYTSFFIAGILIALLASSLGSVALALATQVDLQNSAVRVGTVALLCFMTILVLRRILLLWLGYLQNAETQAPPSDNSASESLPPISIVVPAYNEELVIQGALCSLLQQDYPRFEVLVVDDGSTDATYQRAADIEGVYCGATVRVVSKVNGGKAAALNTGIMLARYPFVLCMDGDSRLSPHALRSMIRRFHDPSVGAVVGNVKVANRVNPLTRLQALEYIEDLNMRRRAQAFVGAVTVDPDTIALFRRDALVQLGGYDRDTVAENADLTLKLLAAGWQIDHEEKAIAFTEAPARLQSLIKQRYRWTRGILQALRNRPSVLISRQTRTPLWFSIALMWFEAVIWPFMNVLGALLFVTLALAVGFSPYVFGWVLLLTLLDVAAALYTVAREGEDLALVPLGVVYRFSFALLIDVIKLFASAEEALKLEMSWGKLERLGRI